MTLTERLLLTCVREAYDYETGTSAYDKSRVAAMPPDEAEEAKLTRKLRWLRQHAFDFEDGSPEDEAHQHEMRDIKAQLLQIRGRRPRPSSPLGPFSGLTRAELAATGTAEPDWY